jgi:hypothetical protein
MLLLLWVLTLNLSAKAQEGPEVEVRSVVDVHGHVREYRRVLDRPELHEAWRDSQGLIWGGMAVKGDQHCPQFEENSREPCLMSFNEAVRYCRERSARLPNMAEWGRIAVQMGARYRDLNDNSQLDFSEWSFLSVGFEGWDISRYSPQALPDLYYRAGASNETNGVRNGRLFWSTQRDQSAFGPASDGSRLVFDGLYGQFMTSFGEERPHAVRCVDRGGGP